MKNDEINEEEPLEKAQLPRPRRKVLKVCLRYFVILAMMPVVFAFVAALMLIGQDVTAPSWVAERIEQRAEAVLDGGQINFEEITVNLGTDFHPRVRMEDVTLFDQTGNQVLTIENLSGLLSPRGVILERKALLQDVILTGLDLNLRRDADGNFSISFGEDRKAIAIDDTIEAVFAQLDAAFDFPALEALENLRLSKFAVTFTDEKTGIEWIGNSKDLLLNLEGDERQLSTDVAIESETSQNPATLSLKYVSKKISSEARLAVDVKANSGSDLAEVLPQFEQLSTINAATTVSLSVVVDEVGQIAPITAKLKLGEGEVALSGDLDPIAISGMSATVIRDPDKGHIEVQELVLASDRLSMTGQGRVTLDPDHGHFGQFQFQDISVLIPEEFDTPLRIDQAYADLRVRTQPLRLDLGVLSFQAGELSVQSSGYFETGEAGWTAALDLHAPQASRAEVLDYWPLERAKGARRWLSNNLKSAQAEEVHGAFRFAHDHTPRFSLGFGFSDAELSIFKDAPHIHDARGYASFDEGSFGLIMTDGFIPAAQGGRIDVAGSSINIEKLRQKHGPMSINLEANSSLTAVLSVLNQSPVRAMDKAGLPVDVADARSILSGTITFPRVNQVPPDQVRFDFDADLSRVVSRNLVPNRTLRSSGLVVAVNNSGLEITGPARFDDVPLTGTYKQVFGESEARLQAVVEISPDALTALDIDLPRGTVSGRGQGTLDLSISREQPPEFLLTSDLRGLRVAVPPVGWSKPPNATGELRVEGRLGDRPEVTDLQISGGGLSARGRVSLNSDGALEAARFSQLRIGNWFDSALTLRGRGEGRPAAVEINGGGLDLRRARFGPRQGESGPVEIALNRIQITSGIALTNFQGSFSGTGGFNGTFQGNLNGGPSINGTVVPQNGRSAIRLRSDDAGGIVKAAGLLQGGNGGSMDLVLSPVGAEGTFDGALTMRGLRVREAPAMAALLDAISVVGLLQQLDGQGLSFDEVEAKFRLSPDEVVVSQASAVGPGLGISLDGVYSLASKPRFIF